MNNFIWIFVFFQLILDVLLILRALKSKNNNLYSSKKYSKEDPLFIKILEEEKTVGFKEKSEQIKPKFKKFTLSN